MVRDGKNYFPLTHIDPNITGYFMDTNGDVWSDRARPGQLTKLTGSMTSSGRYMTLQVRNQGGQSFKLAELVRRCKSHPEWKILGMETPVTVPKTDLAAAMGLKTVAASPHVPVIEVKRSDASWPFATPNRAPNTDIGIKQRGWVIARVHAGSLQLGVDPSIYTMESSVDDELVRLASAQPGVKFVKLQIQGAVVGGKVNWE